MSISATAPRANAASILCAPPNRCELILLDLPQALMVVRPDRRLLFSNTRAESLLACGDAREKEGRLARLGQMRELQIEQHLRQALYGAGAKAGVWFPALQIGWLSACRVPPAVAGHADWPNDSLLLLIHVDEPALTQPARIDALCQKCGLTSTERYVLLLLAEGMPAQAIAHQLAVRISTIRTHIRNLLAKTRSRSLMQLVRQVGSTEHLGICVDSPLCSLDTSH